MSETLEQAEERLGAALGSRWHGPVVTKAGTGTSKLGRIRKAWYSNGTLEEVICIAPGYTEPAPEIWPSRVSYFESPPEPEPPPDPTPDRIVKGMDVSSNQGVTDLSYLINTHQPEHVVVKLYQEVEAPTFEGWSLPQLRSAIEHGCTPGGYLWLYHGINVHKQVTDVLQALTRYNIDIPILWIDCETYEGEGPTLAEILEACSWCEAQGTRAGIYSGDWYWRGVLHEPASWEGPWVQYPAWLANYNGRMDFDMLSYYWPPEMVVGHQYTSNPVDLNAFRSDFTVPVAA